MKDEISLIILTVIRSLILYGVYWLMNWISGSPEFAIAVLVIIAINVLWNHSIK